MDHYERADGTAFFVDELPDGRYRWIQPGRVEETITKDELIRRFYKEIAAYERRNR